MPKQVLRWAIYAAGLGYIAPAAAMPSRIWAGADTIFVRCSADTEIEAQFAKRVCNAVISEVGEDAPYPVHNLDAGTVTSPTLGALLFDASITQPSHDSAPLLSIRLAKAVSLDDSEGVIAPPSMPLIQNAASGTLATSVALAVDRVLPWRRNNRSNIKSRLRSVQAF